MHTYEWHYVFAFVLNVLNEFYWAAIFLQKKKNQNKAIVNSSFNRIYDSFLFWCKIAKKAQSKEFIFV